MVRLEEVPLAEFRLLRQEWNAWVEAVGHRTPFLRHEWLCALAETLQAPGYRPLIVRVHRGGRVVGYVPLVLVRVRIRGLLGLWRLHFLGMQLTEFADLLVPEAEVVEECFRALQRWRWLEFVGHYMGPDSPLEAAYVGMVERWSGAEWQRYEPCWYIPIAGRRWEEYVAQEAGREFVVRGVRRRQALYEQVEWAVEEYGAMDEGMVREVVRLHALSQQRKGRGSLFAEDARYWEFLRRVVQEAAAAGWLQLFVLRLQGCWASFVLGFSYGGVFYWWLQGFEPAYERFAPTKVLLWHVLQRGFQEQRWREFNFMGGDTEYKRHWAKRCRWFYRLRLPNWRGVMGWLNRLRWR